MFTCLLARIDVWWRVRREAQASRVAYLQQQAARQAAEQQAMAARLEGVTLAAREIADLLSNELQGPVGAIELLQEEAVLPPDLQELVAAAAASLERAATHLRRLQQVVRVATKDTPMGPALDLERSAASWPE